jgi:hypothetical protein
MRTINIIGCGETASLWDGTGDSIGVNDCEKTGKPVQKLILINWPERFFGERLPVILATKAKVYTDDICDDSWKKYFPDLGVLPMRFYHNGPITPGRIYHAKTSPIVAMSLAAALGATQLILWGVDFKTHHRYKPGGTPSFTHEMKRYVDFANELKRNGCRVFLGSKESFLSNHLPVLLDG